MTWLLIHLFLLFFSGGIFSLSLGYALLLLLYADDMHTVSSVNESSTEATFVAYTHMHSMHTHIKRHTHTRTFIRNNVCMCLCASASLFRIHENYNVHILNGYVRMTAAPSMRLSDTLAQIVNFPLFFFCVRSERNEAMFTR